MNPQGAVQTLESMGWEIRLQGESLRLVPPQGAEKTQRVDAMLQQLKTNKPQIIAHLQARQMPLVEVSQPFKPVTLCTRDMEQCKKVKAHIDSGGLRLAGKVRYHRRSGLIELPLQPLVPPEWIDVLQEGDICHS